MINPRMTDIFSSFTPDELDLAEKYFILQKYHKDAIILAQGDSSEKLHVLLSGAVKSTLNLPGSIERKQGELASGDIFGESAVFGGKPMLATYTATEECELLILDRQCFTGLITQHPECGVKLVAAVLSRTVRQFRKTSSFLSDVVQWGEQASRRVITDEQTGIYNRAFLEDALENFFTISKSNSKPLSLLMLDLDNCRKVNEQISMDAGNQIICEFSRIVTGIISKTGIAARYGGDEFCILLPETGLKKACAVAEEIRSAIEHHDFSAILQGRDIKITASIGISSYPETATELEDFRKKADASLYKAKEGGKNRCAFVK